VDIFYHHRPDADTPLEETMGTLDSIVRQGKALYIGLSNYPPDLTQKAVNILKTLGTPCLIHQPSYSMFNRWIEEGLIDTLSSLGIGCIAFSPLAQGLLTNRYLNGIPEDSRASKPHGFLKSDQITDERMSQIKQLNTLAKNRGQTLAQMALVWVLRHPTMTSVVIGASKVGQLEDNVAALKILDFSDEELTHIEDILHQ
jgi:L-glyceraldehyde 3-phosphate reductase